jgi:3-hexulose-6-phosphate synthase
MKQLQIALDLFSSDQALAILSQTADYIDIIEIGTPLMVAEGAQAVWKIKNRYPDKIVFADIKVMDGGGIVPRPVLEAGADMFSVLAAADDATIAAAIELAHTHKAKVLADLCAVKDLAGRAAQLEQAGPDILCVHVGLDAQSKGADPFAQLQKIQNCRLAKAIAGGINLETIRQAAHSDAQIIISGAGIYGSSDMQRTAMQMQAIIREVEHL